MLSVVQRRDRKLRLAVVQYMEEHSADFIASKTVSDYIMKQYPATVVEIQATAAFLVVNLFCSGGTWQIYVSKSHNSAAEKYSKSKYLQVKKVRQLKMKYSTNLWYSTLFQNYVKLLSKTKYSENIGHKQKVQKMSKLKYQVNVLHQETLKLMNKLK